MEQQGIRLFFKAAMLTVDFLFILSLLPLPSRGGSSGIPPYPSVDLFTSILSIIDSNSISIPSPFIADT